MTPELIAAIIVAIIAASPGVYATVRQIKSDRVDVATKYEAMASKQADQIADLKRKFETLQDDFTKLLDENTQLLQEIEDLKTYIQELIGFIERNGLKPPARPVTRPRMPRSLE